MSTAARSRRGRPALSRKDASRSDAPTNQGGLVDGAAMATHRTTASAAGHLSISLAPFAAALDAVKRDILLADSAVDGLSRENQTLKSAYDEAHKKLAVLERLSRDQNELISSSLAVLRQLIPAVHPDEKKIIIQNLSAFETKQNSVNAELDALQLAAMQRSSTSDGPPAITPPGSLPVRSDQPFQSQGIGSFHSSKRMSITNLQQSKAKRVASVHPKVARNSQTSNSATLEQSTLSIHSDSPATVVPPSPAGVSQQQQQHSSNQQQPFLRENRSASSSSHSWFQTALDTPIHSTVASSAPVPSGSNRDTEDVGQIGAMSAQNGANAAALLQALSKRVEQPQNEHDHTNTWTNETNYFGADNSLGTTQTALAFHSALAYHSAGFGGQEVQVGATQTPRNIASSGSTFTFPGVSSADQEEETLNEGLDDRDFFIDGPLPSFTRKIRFQTDDLVSSVFFANPFGLAYTGSSKNELQIWNILKSLEENIPTHVGTLNLEGGTAGYTRVIKVSPNGHTMVCGGEYNEIILSDATSAIPKIRSRMRAESGPTFSAIFMADDRTMVTTHGNGAVELWDVHNARWIRTLGRHELDATCCGIINEADQIISGSGDKTVRIWDVRGGTYSGESDAGSNYEVFRLGMENDVYCLGCDPERDGTVAIGLSCGMISLISFAHSQAPVLIEDVNDSIGKGITSLKYSHGGNWLVSTGMDQKLSIWSPNLEKLAEMEEPGVIISNDVFSSMSNGLYILNGLTDKSAVLHYADC